MIDIQKIGYSLFDSAGMSEVDIRNAVNISKDGCVVLFDRIIAYGTGCFPCQLWEFTLESGWELHFDGTIEGKFPVRFLSLNGTQNCRRLTKTN